MKNAFLLAVSLIIITSCSKENAEQPQAETIVKPGTVQFDFNGKTISFDAKWIDLLGSKVSVTEKTDSLIDFSFDIGTKLEKRSYPIIDGSLSSTSSRLSYQDKKTNSYYKAISGTLTITNVDNSMLTGTFSGVFKNQSTNDTLNFTNGKIEQVGQ